MNTLPVTHQPKQYARLMPSGMNSAGYAYSIGTVSARFPSLSVEKEFFQALPDPGTSSVSAFNITDEVALKQLNESASLSANLYAVLSQPDNLYIAREMCWALTAMDGSQIAALLPNSNARLTSLIQAIKPAANNSLPTMIIIGQLNASGAGTDVACELNGRTILVSNLISASPNALLTRVSAAIPSVNSTQLTDLVQEIISLAANNGLEDEDRALNYLLYNNISLYVQSYKFLYGSASNGPNPSGYQLVNVRLKMDRSSGRSIAKVIFDYQGINTGAPQSWYSSVDVSGEFPFLLTAFARYLQRN